MKLGLSLGIVLGAAAVSGCGYRAAALGRGAGAPSYSVGAAPAQTPYLDALESALAGARAELSREGALRSGASYPRLVVELVRVDEVAAGIRELAPGPGAGPAPLARASAVGVTIRAWAEERAGGAPLGDSGDVRRVETVAQGGDVLGAASDAGEAVRAASRRAAQAAVRRVLGLAEPGSDAL